MSLVILVKRILIKKESFVQSSRPIALSYSRDVMEIVKRRVGIRDIHRTYRRDVIYSLRKN